MFCGSLASLALKYPRRRHLFLVLQKYAPPAGIFKSQRRHSDLSYVILKELFCPTPDCAVLLRQPFKREEELPRIIL